MCSSPRIVRRGVKRRRLAIGNCGSSAAILKEPLPAPLTAPLPLPFPLSPPHSVVHSHRHLQNQVQTSTKFLKKLPSKIHNLFRKMSDLQDPDRLV